MSNPNQGAATRVRNQEIERRLTAGESGPELAKAFGITQPRIFQIARAVREGRGEAKPRVRRPRVEAAPVAVDHQPTRPNPAPYTGPVTVVPGTQVAPHPFQLSPVLALAAQRARAVQGPMRSLAGIRELAK